MYTSNKGGGTEAKTSIEWGNWDKNLVDSSKKEKTDYTYIKSQQQRKF